MKDGGNRKDKISELAASILTLGLTIAGFSGLQLKLWWHYPVMVISILLLYVVCFFVVQLAHLLLDHIKRATIKTDVNEEFRELLKSVDILYFKIAQYDDVVISEFKKILENEIAEQFRITNNNIAFIRQYYDSSLPKNKGILPDKQHLESVEKFCDAVKEKFSL